jgi:hypothetical protein
MTEVNKFGGKAIAGNRMRKNRDAVMTRKEGLRLFRQGSEAQEKGPKCSFFASLFVLFPVFFIAVFLPRGYLYFFIIKENGNMPLGF